VSLSEPVNRELIRDLYSAVPSDLRARLLLITKRDVAAYRPPEGSFIQSIVKSLTTPVPAVQITPSDPMSWNRDRPKRDSISFGGMSAVAL